MPMESILGDYNSGACMREKYWSEMNPDERVEKLRKELERTQQYLKTISEYISCIIRHDHVQGRMVAPVILPQEEVYGLRFFPYNFSK